MPPVRRGTTKTCPKAAVDNQQHPRRLTVTAASQRFDRLLYDSRRVNGWQPRKMPQKTLGSIIGLLCTVATLVQVSRRLRICCRPTLVSRGRGSQGGWRPPVDPFCLLHKGTRARSAAVNRVWRQLLKVFISISSSTVMEGLDIYSESRRVCCVVLPSKWRLTLAAANWYPVFGVFIHRCGYWLDEESKKKSRPDLAV